MAENEIDDMTTDDLLEHFRTERRKIQNLRVPSIRMTNGSDADEAYRVEVSADYALAFIDVLLQRIKMLEDRLDGPSSQ